MGLNIRDIVPRKEISFESLNGKIIAVDAFNTLYQFLSSIRQYDGSSLQDSKGRITSHLSGLFYRNIALLSDEIKLIYVFDGKPPALKYKTHEARREAKDEAREKYEKAKSEEDIEGMGKYSRQLAYLTGEMIEESKELLEAMGIAVVQGAGEGEAQAAWLAKNNEAYAVASQDYDSLLFGAPRLIQNLTMAKTRKTAAFPNPFGPGEVCMAKIIVLSILLFLILRWVSRILILPAKIAEELGNRQREGHPNNPEWTKSKEKDISDRGKIID